MAGENSQIYSVQITGKCICETFPPPLHDLIIGPHVKHPHIMGIINAYFNVNWYHVLLPN